MSDLPVADKRILVVEDNEDHLELILRSFEGRNVHFEVLSASNLGSAREILSTLKPDLLISDWRLPDGDGVELLTTSGVNRAFPLIIMTSHGNEELAVEVMKRGALDYVVKSPENLANMVFFVTRALREWEHITERRKAEEEKNALQKQLFQSQKLEAIGTLAGGIAHDFNNILSGILGYADLALMDLPADSGTSQKIGEIKNACYRAVELIRQILTFSRSSENIVRPLLVQNVIKEALKLIRSSLPATIEIRQDIEAAVPPVLADGTQIHQVITNLCTNAYHAMEDRGGVMTVGVQPVLLSEADCAGQPHLKPGQFVKIWVEDTGKWISPENLDRIFEPFFTTKEPGKGTGLGLATVHGIIANIGGVILVKSTVGVGTIFEIYLPLAEAVPVQEPPVAEPAEVLRQGRGRIFLVDDEPMLVQVGAMGLQNFGYSVTGHTDSLQALAEFERNPSACDLLIADQTMPKLTGLDLITKVRLLRPDLPVILCSGYNEVVDENLSKSLNFHYMKKPIQIKDLVKQVQAFLT